MPAILIITCAVGGAVGIWLYGSDDWILRAWFYAAGSIVTGACVELSNRHN